MTNYAFALEYCPQGVQISNMRESKPVVRLVYQDADLMALLDFPHCLCEAGANFSEQGPPTGLAT
jgi:hypothetical protein